MCGALDVGLTHVRNREKPIELLLVTPASVLTGYDYKRQVRFK